MEEKIIPNSILYNKENNSNIEYLCFTYNVNNKNEKKNGNNNKNNYYTNDGCSQQVLLFDKIEKEIQLEYCSLKSLHLYINKERITDNRKTKIYLELFTWFSNKKRIHIFKNDIIFNETLSSIKQYNKELYLFIIEIKKKIHENCNTDTDEEMEEEEDNSDSNDNDNKNDNCDKEYKKENSSNYTIQSKEIFQNQLVTFTFRFIIKKDKVNNKNNYLMKLSIY